MLRAVFAVGVSLVVLQGVAVPELIFHVPFDGTADAVVAKGGARPLRAENLEFAPGKRGQAVRIRGGARPALEYALPGNLVPERGTVAMWVKREWTPQNAAAYHALFSTPFPEDRLGTGALALWFRFGALRADVSDRGDSHFERSVGPMNGQWDHYAFVWDGALVGISWNGKLVWRMTSGSPVASALRAKDGPAEAFTRRAFDRFFVGSRAGLFPADALIDDFRIYSEPLSAEQIRELFEASATDAERAVVAPPDYPSLFAARGANPYEGRPSAAAVPPLDLEPVETVELDAKSVEALSRNSRFKSHGGHSFGALGGTPYLEAAETAGARFAVRFRLDAAAPLHLFEIDYPDDRKRTMDLIVQDCQNERWDGTPGADYTLQVGVLTGDVAPLSGKMLKHKCVYWTRGSDVALCAMTARAGVPAAIARIKVWKVRDGKLPPLAVREPKPANGWNRQIGLYFEDPAIAYDFPLPDYGCTPKGMTELVTRTAALMKFSGETTLVYPGAWYGGLLDDAYNPRQAAPDFLSAWYEGFDREGLYVIPTLNLWNIRYKGPYVSRKSLEDGSLHDTAVSILETGKPNIGGRHGSNPNYNIAHPDVQAYVEEVVDTLLAQGATHPSFKGLCIHFGLHTCTTWGSAANGYNDYAIAAFEKACGVKVSVDRKDPMRGKAYAEWIRARPDVFEKWLAWRCRVLTDFWGRIARKMAARRPDLKLWFNCYPMTGVTFRDFLEKDFTSRVMREAGVDAEMLGRAADNIVVSPCLVPADYRWRRPASFPDRADDRAVKNREYFRMPESYSFTWDGESFPWVALHDLYWESAIGGDGTVCGRGKAGKESDTLNSPWLRECRWRVTTLNPAGRHALAHLVAPLRFKDVLGLSKGGFLIGTYGMEEPLREFAAAFRALPAVKMSEFFRTGNVVGREADYGGKRYFYLVNTDERPVRFPFEFPAGAQNLVSGERLTGRREVRLEPYELRSYGAMK